MADCNKLFYPLAKNNPLLRCFEQVEADRRKYGREAAAKMHEAEDEANASKRRFTHR